MPADGLILLIAGISRGDFGEIGAVVGARLNAFDQVGRKDTSDKALDCCFEIARFFTTREWGLYITDFVT